LSDSCRENSSEQYFTPTRSFPGNGLWSDEVGFQSENPLSFLTLKGARNEATTRIHADRIDDHDRHSETSKATVYNTLNLFLEQRLIREVIVDPSKVFYDPNTEPHHHLYNIDTGELTDIDAGSIGITGLPPLPEGMVTEGVDIIVRVRKP